MATVVQLQPRKTRCWITSFVEATDHLDSPQLFRKWAAINALSAALERKVFLKVQHRQLFANLYTLLVGPPGVGKTTAIEFARKVLHSLSRLHLAPPKVTREKFLQLIAGVMKLDQDVESMTHSSYACFLDEVATFFVPGDTDFLILLTQLYDCPVHFEYSLISRNATTIEYAYVSILGALTPRMVAEIFGPRALGMGFTSRVLFIYSEDFVEMPPFPNTAAPSFTALEEDIEKVHQLRGEYTLTDEAMAFVVAWHKQKMPPLPSDSRFDEYLPRRFRHWMKLSMITAAGRRDSRLITLEDVQYTKELLLEAEETMPLALEHMGQNPMVEASTRVHRWASVEYNANGKQAIHEKHIRAKLLQSGISPQYLESTLQSLITSGGFVQGSGVYPNRHFIPVRRE